MYKIVLLIFNIWLIMMDLYGPWAEIPPPLGIFVDQLYYVPSYFQVVCGFSMHGQGHQRSSKYGTLYV